jgi:hypothetical protein
VREVDEHLKPFADYVMTFFTADAGNQAHTAGIVFVPRVVETLRPGSL